MKHFLFLILLTISSLASGQDITDSYILEMRQGTSRAFLSSNNSRHHSVIEAKSLSHTLEILLIKTSKKADIEFEKWISNHPSILSWSYDRYTEKRNDPNDEYFNLQENLNLISAPTAWETTTGGKDILNREIVVAVLDDSFDYTHPDLIDNIYFNENEIENDGIDNDQNGYIDDYAGWYFAEENDDHPITDNHGIAVSGIIGAKGNNQMGVSGINWNIKIMLVSGIAKQSEVIGGYQYVLDQRKLYNETNGEKGAYVVVTNYSAGIDGGFGSSPQYQSWCRMYDELGKVGIISVGATANKDVNVDVDGDIPTTCPSNFLISVTNIDLNGNKVVKAGYGEVHIDLGAPGRDVLSLELNGGYDQNFSGTSSSTPHVTGAVALLYSVPCNAIADVALTNPTFAAKEIRDALLDGVVENPTLTGITATGGRLDILGALEKLQNVCTELQLPSIKGELEIMKVDRSQTDRYEIEYITPDETEYNLMIGDVMGRIIKHFTFTPPSFGRKSINVEVPELPSGIYFISIYNNDNIKSSWINH